MNKLDEILLSFYLRLRVKKPGQGIIEYAGAMIVAAFVVAAVLLSGKSGMGSMYNSIYGAVQNIFLAQSGNI